ncbi:MAG: extracellular solute-binding protein [Spirochaetales bacterium]|nr:extracellular solute-binding protein [Spirochaetales bacterium]
MKKALLVLLAVLLVAGSVFAQSATETKASSGPDELTYWATLNAAITANSFDELPYWQELMARTNTKITFQHVAANNNVAEAFAVLTASRRSMPDIIEYQWINYAGGPQKAIDDGVIIALNDYLDYAPNLKKFLETHPDIANMVKTDEGNYYCFPFLRGDTYENNTLLYTEGWVYRTDLLEKAGVYAIPETPDELYDALVKIKASGLVEWPIAIRSDHINRVFAPGFDSWGENEGIYVDNGVVKSGLLEPNRYDYLVFLNKLYTEGLLYNDYLTLDKKGMGNLILNSTTAIGYAPGGSGIGTWLPQMQKEDPTVSMSSAKPLSPEKGRLSMFAKMDTIYSNAGASAAITTSCKNIEAAMRLLDYQYSEEGHMLANYGIEGVSYKMENGEPVYLEPVLNDTGVLDSTKAWQYMRFTINGPFVQEPEAQKYYYAVPELQEALVLWAQTTYGEHDMSLITVSSEHADDYARIVNDVKTYAKEWENKFITGATPLNEQTFAEYQAGLKGLKLEQAVAWRQEAYDKYISR